MSSFFTLIYLLLVTVATGLRDSGQDGRVLQSTWSQRALAFKSYFSEFGISSKFVLEEPGTPQNKAVLWLADQDPRQLPVPTQSVRSQSGYRAMQRYLLAVSYFQMGGTKWAHRLGFLSGNSTCNWNQQVTSNVTLRGTFGRGRSRTIGVECDAKGQVVNLTLPSINAKRCIPAEMECLTSLATVDLSGNSNVTCSEHQLPPTLYDKVTTN